MMSSNIVRQSASIDQSEYQALGETGVNRLMAEVEAKTFAVAAKAGIADSVVRARQWDLDVVCGFTDYPMYLCGPNAPQIKSAADVFKHVWHLDNPRAKYTVVVESQAELDSYEAHFWADLIEEAKRTGMEAAQRRCNWTPDVMDELNRRIRADRS